MGGVDRFGFHRGLLVDEQVGVSGAGPSFVPVGEPFEDQLVRQVVQGPGASGDGGRWETGPLSVGAHMVPSVIRPAGSAGPGKEY